MKAYLLNLLIAIDQFANTVLNGSPDETLSARAYRCDWDLAVSFINALFFDTGHCRNAYLSEKNRGQLPPSYNL